MAEYIRAMDTGGGGRAADTSNAGRWIAKTANYTITGGEGAFTFSNSGATGAVTFTLTAIPVQGRKIRFRRTADFSFAVTASASVGGTPVQIRGLTIGTTITAATAGQTATLTLEGSAGHWVIDSQVGTWTIS